MNPEKPQIPIKTTSAEKEVLSPAQKTEKRLQREEAELKAEIKRLQNKTPRGKKEAIRELEEKIELLRTDQIKYANQKYENAKESIFGRRTEKKWQEVASSLAETQSKNYSTERAGESLANREKYAEYLDNLTEEERSLLRKLAHEIKQEIRKLNRRLDRAIAKKVTMEPVVYFNEKINELKKLLKNNLPPQQIEDEWEKYKERERIEKEAK